MRDEEKPNEVSKKLAEIYETPGANFLLACLLQFPPIIRNAGEDWEFRCVFHV
jgi:hypothetical protein